MRKQYATVKIPVELSSRLDEYVAKLGYRSRAEIVNDAIRRFIDIRVQMDEQTVHTQNPVEHILTT